MGRFTYIIFRRCDMFHFILSITSLLIVLHSCDGLSSSWPTPSTEWSDRSTGLSSVSGVIWGPEYLQSRVHFRLVKKSWKPKGLAFDNPVDEFPGGVMDAYKIMRESGDYAYIDRPLPEADQLFTASDGGAGPEFDKNLESIIIFHPLGSHADERFFTVTTITVLGMRNMHKKYNIFVSDMPILNVNMFSTVVRQLFGLPTQYEPMAEILSTFIVKGVQQGHWEPGKIHLIGYSYSGNLVGYMGRVIQFIFKQKLGSIICLDPYSAQYNNNLIHVSKDDAEIVHIYHTSSFLEGTRERIATADFVFNDGFLQPECIGVKNIMNRLTHLWKTVPEPFTCSHLKVVPRFWYVILYPSKFKARQCDTWQRFQNCLCEENQEATLSYPIASRSVEGTYFMKTHYTKPYGIGEEGSHCSPKRKEELENKINSLIKSNGA